MAFSLMILLCQAGLAITGEAQESWPRALSPGHGRKSFNMEVNNLLGAKDKVILQVLPGEQKDLDELGGETRPTKICIANKQATSCYIAHARTNFARDPQASLIEIGGGQSAVLFEARYVGINDEWKSVAVLGLSSRGKLINLLPAVAVSMQDQFRLWHDAEIADGELITVANYVWKLRPPEEETHFSFHHYQISTYAFCPGSGRYLLVDRFTTRKKFAGLDDEDHPGNRVLNTMMLHVKTRMFRHREAGKSPCPSGN